MLWWTLRQAKSKTPETRLAAAEKLGACADVRGSVALGELLGDELPEVRLAALTALQKLDRPEAVPYLVKTLRHSDPALRVQAALNLQTRKGNEALSELAAALSDEIHKVRTAAAAALESMGWKPSTPKDDAAWRIATGRCDLLSGLGPVVIAPIVRALRDPDCPYRPGLVRALSEVSAPEAEKALQDLSLATDSSLRAAVISSMAAKNSGKHLVTLANALRDEDENIRNLASAAIRDLKPGWESTGEARLAADAFRAALKLRDYQTRQVAANALAKINSATA